MAAIEAKLLAHHNIRRIAVEVAVEPASDGAAADSRPNAARPTTSTAASAAPAPAGPNNGRRPNA